MASLNDFNWPNEDQRRRKKIGFFGSIHLWIQIVLSIILFLFVGQYINSEDLKGDFSRYVLGDGMAMESSWLSYDNIIPAASEDTVSDTVFLMPLLGVAVRDFSLDSDNGTNTSLIIQGESGQDVTSTAKGMVSYLEETVTGWIIKIDHANDFQSVYQGLVSVEVELNDTVEAGAPVGTIGEDPLTFTLLKGGIVEDPLKWLFREDISDTSS